MLIQLKDGDLLVVRRCFKAQGRLYQVGEVIENPNDIKFIRSRLASRDVILLNANEKERAINWVPYLEARSQQEIDPRIYAVANGEIPTIEAKAEIPVETPAPIVESTPQAEKKPSVDAQTEPKVVQSTPAAKPAQRVAGRTTTRTIPRTSSK